MPALNTSPIEADGVYTFEWAGGRGIWEIDGTWGSGTANLQRLSRDGSTFVNLTSDGTTTLTADGGVEFTFRKGTMAVAVTSSTSPELYTSIEPVRER